MGEGLGPAPRELRLGQGAAVVVMGRKGTGCPAWRDVTLSLKNPTGVVAALTPALCPAWVSPHMDMKGTVDLVSS